MPWGRGPDGRRSAFLAADRRIAAHALVHCEIEIDADLHAAVQRLRLCGDRVFRAGIRKGIGIGQHQVHERVGAVLHLLKLVGASQSGLTVEAFHEVVKQWTRSAKHPRFQRPYTDLVYAPMLEAMRYLRANGYRTYIVTGGGQEFVRAFADAVYGVPCTSCT